MLDAFNHVLPPRVFDRLKAVAPGLPVLDLFERLTPLWDLEARLRIMDAFDGYRQVICLSNPPPEIVGGSGASTEFARLANDEMATLCQLHPDRFPGFVASLPMDDPDAAIGEAERALGKLGAVGVQVFTNIAGRPLSDPELRPLFQLMAARDRPVLVHPMRTAAFADYASEAASEDEIWFTFGWPYETSACVTRLIYAGLFDALPGLKIVTHHMGGMIPYFSEKIALGFSQIFHGTPTHNPLRDHKRLQREPIEYFRMLYADTAVNGSAASARCGHAFFGTEQCLFATDAPFDPVGGRNLITGTIAAVRALDLDAAGQARVFEGNARRLFGLGPSA